MLEKDEKKKTITPNTEGITQEMTQSFSIDEMRMTWRRYAHNMKNIGNGNLYTAMTCSDPMLNENFNITHNVSNNIQREFLITDMHNILHFLRKELKNSSIEVTINTEETNESKLFTSQEKYNDMASRNPDLNIFRNTFKLDIDL